MRHLLGQCVTVFVFSVLVADIPSAARADDAVTQAELVTPPPLPDGFKPHEFTLPEGCTSQLAAGPPLVTHPTMGCFDDRGRLFVCNNAGVNMSAAELEQNLPNSINVLEDQDGDGVFDKSTVFADKMTFPMGGAWHDGALYVASPPNIWRLADTDGDGVADKRDIIVNSFGFTGNAASIHGCFFSPDGRLYWCDGYHGHEFKDKDGNIVSRRKGSYIFSCWPDGSDVRIHCGGGMDNPVELDFTEEGDVIGTVNILYTRPRVDCLVHWQYGGAYPHREAVLDELKVTGDLLGPIHRFGHVAISGTTRYRSGVIDERWRGNYFATEFNLGKVVRVELERSGSTYSCLEREFLSCSSRDFHPTDVLEDADGSLLVIDTGGWFYRGCPTSQIAKPDILGGIYRIRRDGMTTPEDPRGLSFDWAARGESQLMQDLQDTRFAVRERAIQECVRRGQKIVDCLAATIKSGDTIARRNAIWAATRIFKASQNGKARIALLRALQDSDAGNRQAAWHGIGAASVLPNDNPESPDSEVKDPFRNAIQDIIANEPSAAVRREAFATCAALKLDGFEWIHALQHMNPQSRSRDREERHAFLFALLESREGRSEIPNDRDVTESFSQTKFDAEYLVVMDQIFVDGLPTDVLRSCITEGVPESVETAARIVRRRVAQGKLPSNDLEELQNAAAERIRDLASSDYSESSAKQLTVMIRAFGNSAAVAAAVAAPLHSSESPPDLRQTLLESIAADASLPPHECWEGPIAELMQSPQTSERLLAIRAAGAVGSARFIDRLLPLASDESEPIPVQMEALKAVVRNGQALSEGGVFSLMLRLVRDGTVAQRRTAAQLLGESSLTAEQLVQLVPVLKDTGPQQLVDLVKLFKRSLTPDLAEAFLENVENARSLTSLPMLEVSEVVKRFPPELHGRANALLDRMQAAEQQKLLKLDSLAAELGSGDAARGKDIFFSEKAKCATCHVVGDKGKRAGPDLTTIGANRAPKDLLESIIFPSSTIVRQYEPYTLLTTSGRSYSGLVIRDASESITIQQATADPVTIAREDIEELVPSTVSIMPKGLDEALTPQQIADMVAWLQTLR